MGLWTDLKVLYHLNLKPIRGESHRERLDDFYRHQAQDYDAYRRKLLLGREEMFGKISFPRAGVWIDLGCGTGSALDFVGDELSGLKKVYLVDLCPSLLEVARRRVTEHGLRNVEVVEADVTTFQPEECHADVVTFSYSLTMIPDWFRALQNAQRLLRPGGVIGLVDFYSSRKFPASGRRQHRWLTRNFWPTLFARDNVMLSHDHLPYLEHLFTAQHLSERMAKVPYILWLRVPYYVYIGKRG